MEPYSADAVKRRKWREYDDLGNYETSLLAERLVKVALSRLIQSIFDFDLDMYEFCIELYGQAVGIYEQIRYTAAVDGLNLLIKVLSTVFNLSKEQEWREIEGYEELKHLFGGSHQRLKLRDRALVIGFIAERVVRFKQFYSLYSLELLNCASVETALKLIDETHKRLAVIVIDAASFPDKGVDFYNALTNQKRLRKVVITRYNRN